MNERHPGPPETVPADGTDQGTGEASVTIPASTTVCIVGLGYVGVPLSVAFDEEGLDVVGYDVDAETVDRLDDGTDPTETVGGDRIAEGDVGFAADPAVVGGADYVLVTVPTPVDDLNVPDLSFVESAAETVGEHVTEGTTVVLESTVYPGVTRDRFAPTIAEASDLAHGEDFSVGYSPERLSPGDDGRGLSDVVKIVAGDTDRTMEELAALYERVVDAGVYRAPSIETAEAAKVMENVQRDLNIALVNELSIICDHMDVDTHEVLAAAGTKWNFHDYTPGLVGGHCIPVDPMYLARGAERAGYTPGLILQGREVNEYMPKHVAELAIKGLNENDRVLNDARILVLGLAYKPNVEDIRTSEVSGVVAELEEYGVDVVGFDPHPPDDAMRDHFGIPVQDELELDGFDGVVLATPHDEFRALDPGRMAEALNEDPVLVDVMGVLEERRVVDAGFTYRRL